MNWKLGSQVRISTPNGDVYVAPNRIHHYSCTKYNGFYTLSGDKNIALPFIVPEDYMKTDDFSDGLDKVATRLSLLFA